jgi:uncharacterized membrane protein
MRSSPELALCLLLAACTSPRVDDPEPDACESSIVNQANFGEPFLLDWCRGCHSSDLTVEHRQNAPLNVDFDHMDTVREMAPRITIRAGTTMPTMPPAAGPSIEERELLIEWLACGAP